MSDTIDVDAKPIDTELDTLTKAERWLAGASERVAERCELYRPPEMIESDRQRKDCVSARSQVRKDAAEIDNERKAILRGIEDALKKFKSEVKDVISPLTDLDAEYKALLDEYEERWRAKRAMELSEEYEALAPDLVPLVPFDRLSERFGTTPKKVWLNRSTNIQAAKQMLADAIGTIADAEATIREQVPEQDVEDTLLSYFGSLDLQSALSGARRLREQRENLARLEAERAAREAQWAEPAPEPVVEQATEQATEQFADPDAPQWWTVTMFATKDKMLHLRDVTRTMGIPVDRAYSGTLREVYERLYHA